MVDRGDNNRFVMLFNGVALLKNFNYQPHDKSSGNLKKSVNRIRKIRFVTTYKF